MLILLACQRLHTHAATESQGNRIHRGQSPLQLVAIVTGLRLEHRQHVDITVRPSLGQGLGSSRPRWLPW